MEINFKKIFAVPLLIIISLFFSSCVKAPSYLQLKPQEEKQTRQPFAAGNFYPADKEKLESTINQFLNSVAYYPPIDNSLRVLIVPHAGLEYSGQVAAWGFKQIKNKPYKNIILLGPSHQVAFQGGAVFDRGSWQTPLGEVQINVELAQKLTSQSNEIKSNFNAHANEHSLEIELPFLQTLLTDFKIIPILLGQTTPQSQELIAHSLAENMTADTLLVLSSDLSHYPSYKDAVKIDGITIGGILTGSVQDLESSLSAIQTQAIPNLETPACGLDAIKIGLLVAKKINATQTRLLKYQNSGDRKPSERERVVGYAAIGFYDDKPALLDINTPLEKDEQTKLLELARQTIEFYLETKETPAVKIDSPALNQKQGVFVTLEKNDELRGCIGTFSQETPIFKNVQEMAISAATADTRFSPVTADELKDIQIEISILSIPQKISDLSQIQMGQDGVIIKKDSLQGTFLPQVAETIPQKEEFLAELCRQKLGLPSNCYQDQDTEIFTYTAQVFAEEIIRQD